MKHKNISLTQTNIQIYQPKAKKLATHATPINWPIQQTQPSSGPKHVIYKRDISAKNYKITPEFLEASIHSIEVGACIRQIVI